MNPPPALQIQLKPSRARHNSNHRKRRRKAAKSSKDTDNPTPRSAQHNPSASTGASNVENSRRLPAPDRLSRPVAASGCIEGVAKKKTSRGRPNRPWKPWAKLSLNDIESISERRGNSGRGYEQ
jgi:hypothetical protein